MKTKNNTASDFTAKKSFPDGYKKLESKHDTCFASGKVVEHKSAPTTGTRPVSNSPDWFIVEVDHVVDILIDNAKELALGNVNFLEAEWFLKGVIAVLRNVQGPARQELIRRLNDMPSSFASVDRAYNDALDNLITKIIRHLGLNQKNTLNH